MTFRVDLPVYSGPMDLLLHLIKEREVDVHDIPIALILGGALAIYLGIEDIKTSASSEEEPPPSPPAEKEKKE